MNTPVADSIAFHQRTKMCFWNSQPQSTRSAEEVDIILARNDAGPDLRDLLKAGFRTLLNVSAQISRTSTSEAPRVLVQRRTGNVRDADVLVVEPDALPSFSDARPD